MDIIVTNNLSERKIKMYAKGRRGYLSLLKVIMITKYSGILSRKDMRILIYGI